MNGVKTEEAAIVRPISVQPRTRLSFLNMRKTSDPQRDLNHVNGDRDPPASSHGRSMSRDKDNTATTTATTTAQRRTSFFRAPPGDLNRTGTGDQSHYSEGRRPSEASGRGEQGSDAGGGGPGLTKRGSVRKRLSMLKLGKKSSKAALMGSLDEE